MTLPPMWKVRRELRSGFPKLGKLYHRTVHDPVRKVIYDRRSKQLIKITPGKLTLTDRVAVVVLFQPNGLAPSVQLTLDHLARNRFSVVLVSNAPLGPDDRAALARSSAVLLERPNVGYDFGGYRDGIRYLWSLRHALSRLVLMNDSTWFPLRRDDDSLARMEALGADLAGHVYKTEDRRNRLQDHIESHLLMFSRDFLASDGFRQFWRRYRMSDDRGTTIRFGEKGLSQFAIRSGLKVRALLGRDELVACLERCSETELAEVLHHTADGFPSKFENADRIRAAAANGEAWRDDYIAWVHRSLSNTTSYGVSGTFVMPAMVYGRLAFAKKGRDLPHQSARAKILELEADGVIPPLDTAVRDEMMASVAAWQPPRGVEFPGRPLKSKPAATG